MVYRKKKRQQQEEAERVIEDAKHAVETEKPDPNQEYLEIAEEYSSLYWKTRETAKLVRAARQLEDRESEDAYRARLKELRPKRTPLRKKLGIGDPAEICLSWDKDGIYSESARAKDFILTNYYLNNEIDPASWNVGIVLSVDETEPEHEGTSEGWDKYGQQKYKTILHRDAGICTGKYYARRYLYKHPLDTRSPEELLKLLKTEYNWIAARETNLKPQPLEAAIEYLHKLQDCSDNVRVKIQGKRS